MTFAKRQDVLDIEQEMPWDRREPPQTIYQMLRETTDRHTERPAISYQLLSGPRDSSQTLSWEQFHAEICQIANLFRSLGIGESDVVALVLPNCLETAGATIGGMVAGIVNPINPLLDAETIGSLLRETGAKIMVTLKSFPDSDIAQKAAEAVQAAPDIHTVIEIDLNRYLSPPKSWIVPFIRPKTSVQHQAKVLSYHKAIKSQPKTLAFADSTQDRVGAYFHTGGTTGTPKMAQHRYSGLVYNGWLGDRLLFDADDNIMCPLPLFHVFACHVLLLAALKSGAHVVFPTPGGYRGAGVFDNFWKLCERWKISFVITVPTAVSALMQRKVDADISSVKNAFSGSAPMPLELFKRFEGATGVGVIEGYGLTEATCLVSCNPPDGAKKVGSVGLPLPYTDVKIMELAAGETRECGVDEVGEICIFSPGVYPGHTYTDAAKNAELYHCEKYLRTGDLGRLDEDGYLWITGRAKDLIIRGGHNIDPAKIEDVLAGHPEVAMAGAIGQPDAHSGEVPCAYVELVDGGTVSNEALMAYCKEHMNERAAVPKYIEVLDELPRTGVGKLFKPDLRKMAITRIYDDALKEAGLPVRVVEVIDSKKRGLVARLESSGEAESAVVTRALASFTRPWEWAGEE